MVWVILDFGISPKDLYYGVPFWKCLTKITWPTDDTVSNTKTVTVSFSNLNGGKIQNPLQEGNLTVDVTCNSVVVPRSALLCSNDGELSIVFNATRAGTEFLMLLALSVNFDYFSVDIQVHIELS